MLKTEGRLAGLLWLLSTVSGGFSMSYIRSNILVSGDPAATATHLAASESLFRMAILSGLCSQLFLFVFGLTLFSIFQDMAPRLARVLLLSVMLTVAVAVINSLNPFAALLLANRPDYVTTFSPEQLNAAAFFFLKIGNSYGQALVELFWVPFFFSFGLLIMKSRFLPALLGFLLLLMSGGYALNLIDKFLTPTFHPGFFTEVAMAFGALGGVTTILWLLIFGTKARPAEVADSVPQAL